MRAIVVLLLLVVVVGLTWMNYQRGQDKIKAGQAEVQKKAAKEMATVTSQTDSLTTLLGAQQSAFGDSLIRKDSKYQAVIDSLEQAMQTRDKQVADLKLAAKTKPKPTQTASTQKKKPATTVVTDEAAKRHLEILTYYRNRFKTLPTDLSEYERKVAVNEIRQETMEKFAITSVQLDRIRSDNNLNF